MKRILTTLALSLSIVSAFGQNFNNDFIKGYAFTSVQFIILLILAIAGWKSWSDKIKQGQDA